MYLQRWETLESLRHLQSEVLIPDQVPPEFIVGGYVAHASAVAEAQQMTGRPELIEKDSSFFIFEPSTEALCTQANALVSKFEARVYGPGDDGEEDGWGDDAEEDAEWPDSYIEHMKLAYPDDPEWDEPDNEFGLVSKEERLERSELLSEMMEAEESLRHELGDDFENPSIGWKEFHAMSGDWDDNGDDDFDEYPQ